MSKLNEAEWSIYAWMNHGTINSDNGLSPGWHHAIICSNAGLFSARTLGQKLYFMEISNIIQENAFEDIVW